MNTERKEWYKKYELIKAIVDSGSLDAVSNDTLKEELMEKEKFFNRELAKNDITPEKKKELGQQRNKFRKENRNKQTQNYMIRQIVEGNMEQIRKNLPKIDILLKDRHKYQQMLDKAIAVELRAKQMRQLQVELTTLDRELEELQEEERDAERAIKKYAKTPEQKIVAQEWLDEVRKKKNENLRTFSNKREELTGMEQEEVTLGQRNEVDSATDKIKLEGKIKRIDQMCELLLQGKSMQSVIAEISKSEGTGVENTLYSVNENRFENSVPETEAATDWSKYFSGYQGENGQYGDELEEPIDWSKYFLDAQEAKQVVEEPVEEPVEEEPVEEEPVEDIFSFFGGQELEEEEVCALRYAVDRLGLNNKERDFIWYDVQSRNEILKIYKNKQISSDDDVDEHDAELLDYYYKNINVQFDVNICKYGIGCGCGYISGKEILEYRKYYRDEIKEVLEGIKTQYPEVTEYDENVVLAILANYGNKFESPSCQRRLHDYFKLLREPNNSTKGNFLVSYDFDGMFSNFKGLFKKEHSWKLFQVNKMRRFANSFSDTCIVHNGERAPLVEVLSDAWGWISELVNGKDELISDIDVKTLPEGKKMPIDLDENGIINSQNVREAMKLIYWNNGERTEATRHSNRDIHHEDEANRDKNGGYEVEE